MSYVPYFFIGPQYTQYSAATKEGASLLSTTCMVLPFGCTPTALNRHQAIGANIIAAFESQGSGVRWSNLATQVAPEDPVTFGVVMGILIWDTIIYLTLTW